MMDGLNVLNVHMVSALPNGQGVRILAPPGPYDVLSPDQAALLAAWLVVLARVDHERLMSAIAAVEQA